MKRQIRRNVFETNSSSMHSIVVMKEDNYITENNVSFGYYYNKEDGTVDFEPADEYGRSPFQILYKFKDKLKYAMAALCDNKEDDYYKEICEVIKEFIPSFTDFNLSGRPESYKKKWYSDERIKEIKKDYDFLGERNDELIFYEYNFGSIDHQSMDLLPSFLEKNNISIKEFLTNNKYVVIIDGDEYCIFKEIKERGLININNIDFEYLAEEAYEYENDITMKE